MCAEPQDVTNRFNVEAVVQAPPHRFNATAQQIMPVVVHQSPNRVNALAERAPLLRQLMAPDRQPATGGAGRLAAQGREAEHLAQVIQEALTRLL